MLQIRYVVRSQHFVMIRADCLLNRLLCKSIDACCKDFLSVNASINASSSTVFPREALMKIAVSFMNENSFSPIRWYVSSVNGVRRTIKSDCFRSVCKSQYVASNFVQLLLFGDGYNKEHPYQIRISLVLQQLHQFGPYR